MNDLALKIEAVLDEEEIEALKKRESNELYSNFIN